MSKRIIFLAMATALLSNVNCIKNGDSFLQGLVFDAVTGQRIISPDLKVYVIAGAATLNATFSSDATGRTGDFSVSGIPDGTFPVVASLTGYQTFEGDRTFHPDYTDFEGPNGFAISSAELRMTNLYRTGNIAMYPTGASAGAVEIQVFDTPTGNPVSGATVVLEPDPINFGAMTNDNSFNANLIPSSSALRQGPQSTTTSAAGLATFAAATLSVGGNYNVNIYNATDVAGLPLANGDDAAVVQVGVLSVKRTVFLAHLNPTLVITNTSKTNKRENAPGDFTTWVLNFNLPIEICFAGNVTTATINGGAAFADGDADTIVWNPGNPDANSALSNGDQTLTVTPNWLTTDANGGDFVNAALGNGLQIRIKGSIGGCVDVNTVTYGPSGAAYNAATNVFGQALNTIQFD